MVAKIYMSEKYDNKILVRGIKPGAASAAFNVRNLMEKGITKIESTGLSHYPPEEIEKIEIIPGQDYAA